MTKTLVLKSSILGEHSQSNQLIQKAVEESSDVVIRDLAAQPVPVLDMDVVTAFNSPESELTESLKTTLALSNTLIEEIKSADTIVIGAPMYNFMVPTQLKSWFDLIARAGVTFSYTETGPVGLIENKKVIIVTTRGGIHANTASDSVNSYLSNMLGFLGMTDIEFVYAEALNMGEEPAAQSRESAQSQLAELV